MIVYLGALALTLAIETPVYAWGLATRSGTPWRRAGMTGVRVNLVSHPIAFLAAFPLLREVIGSPAALVVVEVGVVYMEAALVGRRQDAAPAVALAVSAVANVASLALGLVALR